MRTIEFYCLLHQLFEVAVDEHQIKTIEIAIVASSAKGTESQMPLMPISEGRVNKAASTNISERSSEMMPAISPLPIAV